MKIYYTSALNSLGALQLNVKP